MRILQIDKFLACAGGLAGGTSRYIEQLTARLTARGHTVDAWGCAGPAATEERPAFVDFTTTGPRSLPRMIHSRQAATTLERFLASRSFDIAHLHSIYHHLTPSILPVLRRAGLAVVMTVHDYRLLCPTRHLVRPDGPCRRCVPNRFYHAVSPRCAGLRGLALAAESYVQHISRRYSRGVDALLCPSRTLAALLQEAGYPPETVRTLPNLVAEIDLPAATPPGQNMVLYAGRLSEEKAPELCLEIARQRPDAEVVLAGAGPMEDSLRATVLAEGLSNVSLPGMVGDEALAELLARAAVVVIPSRAMENAPASMLEAMWAGRCVVAVDQPSLREWIDDGVTGRVFGWGDAAGLARVVGQVLDDEPTRTAMARAGRELVRTRHAPAALMEQLEATYRQCAGN